MTVEIDAVLTNAGAQNSAVNFGGQYLVTSIDLGTVCVWLEGSESLLRVMELQYAETVESRELVCSGG